MRSVQTQRGEADAALASAEEAYDLALTRYKAGLGSLLALITVETQVLEQRQLRTELLSRELELSINLIRALGGGFDVQVATQ
jgi:outer membrane protein TolC